jgi:hypothetical protein
MFDLKPKQQSTKKLPQWVESGNEKVTTLYQAILDRIAEIETLILKNKPLTPSQYKIGKSVICKALGYSDSYINKHKNLNTFVEYEQRNLNRSIKAMDTALGLKKAAQGKVSQMRRDILIKEVTELRKDLSQRKSEIYINQLNHLIDSGLSEQQVVTTQRIKHLEETTSDLRKKNAQLESNNKLLTHDLLAQLEINRELKKKINDDTPYMSIIK